MRGFGKSIGDDVCYVYECTGVMGGSECTFIREYVRLFIALDSCVCSDFLNNDFIWKV